MIIFPSCYHFKGFKVGNIIKKYIILYQYIILCKHKISSPIISFKFWEKLTSTFLKIYIFFLSVQLICLTVIVFVLQNDLWPFSLYHKHITKKIQIKTSKKWWFPNMYISKYEKQNRNKTWFEFFFFLKDFQENTLRIMFLKYIILYIAVKTKLS